MSVFFVFSCIVTLVLFSAACYFLRLEIKGESEVSDMPSGVAFGFCLISLCMTSVSFALGF